ncbi:hypothetical protein TWF694_011107 [Orbilia ellipsospora]|uniref:Enoyl-CoA hydratase n=1 Tax=Orbilia ellipsospora TaxID=2528407 RepID=A0AAV9X8G4_9PEZI
MPQSISVWNCIVFFTFAFWLQYITQRPNLIPEFPTAMAAPVEYLKVTKVTPGYWRATFNNPPTNLWGPETSLAVWKLLDDLEKDDSVRVVVFDSAAPNFFVMHLDVTQGIETMVPPGRRWANLVQRLSQSPVVSLAAIRGRARGLGSEFALACDMRFASKEKGIIGQPEVGAGLIPGGGGPEWLPRIVGRSRALEIIIGSDDFDASTAELYGYINRAIPDAEFEEWVDKFARRIGAFPKYAVASMKATVNVRSGLPTGSEFEQSWSTFIDVCQQDETKKRMGKLMEWGIQQDSQCERELGKFIGMLDTHPDWKPEKKTPHEDL